MTFGIYDGWWYGGTDMDNVIDLNESADRKTVSCDVGGEPGYCGITSSIGRLLLTVDGKSVIF